MDLNMKILIVDDFATMRRVAVKGAFDRIDIKREKAGGAVAPEF